MAVLSWISLLNIAVAYFPFAQIGHLFHHASRLFDGPGMFLIAVLDSSFLSIPEGNDLLIVGLSIGKAWSRIAYYVGMTAAGSITGCLLLYAVGRRGGRSLVLSRLAPKKLERIQGLFRKYGVLALVIPSMLPPPCPFKVFVLSAGVFRFRPVRFFAAVALGRFVRYSTWGILAFHFGAPVKTYMQNNLTAVGIVLLSVFVVAIASAFAVIHLRSRLRNGAVPSNPA